MPAVYERCPTCPLRRRPDGDCKSCLGSYVARRGRLEYVLNRPWFVETARPLGPGDFPVMCPGCGHVSPSRPYVRDVPVMCVGPATTNPDHWRRHERTRELVSEYRFTQRGIGWRRWLWWKLTGKLAWP